MIVPDAPPPPHFGSLLREVASHTAVTFFSTFAIQATTFAILALAALLLPVTDFARLSLIVAVVMLSSGLFEWGLNITATKMYGDTHDEGYLRLAFVFRLALVPVGTAVGAAVALTGEPDIGVGIGLGTLLNVWNGIRATDQARQDYASFTRSSVVFAGLRAVAGLTVLLASGEPLLLAVAIYAVPVAASALSASARLARHAFSQPWPPLAGSFGYAVHVYLNAVTFIAIPYVPQFFISSRLDATAIGTYGLILTFVGPISLLVYSIRSVLLPKMLGSASAFEDILWSGRGLALIAALWSTLIAGGAVLAYVLGVVYGARYQEIGATFLIFFIGFSGTSAIGLYSLSVHTRGIPKLASLVGIAKLLVLIPALLFYGDSLTGVVSAVAAVMLGFEILLALILLWSKRP